jgi:Smg protein
MKENVLDLLMYLFENYIYEEPESTPDRESLTASLEEAGFSNVEIERAFAWLDGLAEQRQLPEMGHHSDHPIRVFSPEECQRLDVDARGFILYLENAGVLDAVRREQVLDRLAALDSDEIDIEDVKWVVLMVLFNQPGQEANYAWMEDLMFDGEGELRH